MDNQSKINNASSLAEMQNLLKNNKGHKSIKVGTTVFDSSELSDSQIENTGSFPLLNNLLNGKK